MESERLGFVFFFFWMPMVAANTDSLLSPKGVNYDVAALMAVKSKMKDQLHVLNGWDINSVYPCSWNMVAFSTEGFVVSLLLQNNHLSGSIPPDIGKLSELQTLDISNNRFDGEIPGSMGYLTHLSYLSGLKDKLSSTIPSHFNILFSLTICSAYLCHAGFSGGSVKTSYLVRFLKLLLISQIFHACMERRSFILGFII
ncbi:hypothetical protein I3842_09G070900 [Carya illinoinensis]|uniref:Leucine-rich repeat-containing N-terminal plant-type domain-containing protein n=1 Tax=Carya illinoinensis TaxID=32201 RepID=A0A922E1F2_CARIL|nr:hypothetical protein I3842_09G070900 [Carya illinoinensis]